MSARGKILAMMGGRGEVAQHVADEILREHAHELAEKQRAHLRDHGYEPDCICGSCSACLATEFIDLIDPKKENDG